MDDRAFYRNVREAMENDQRQRLDGATRRREAAADVLFEEQLQRELERREQLDAFNQDVRGMTETDWKLLWLAELEKLQTRFPLVGAAFGITYNADQATLWYYGDQEHELVMRQKTIPEMTERGWLARALYYLPSQDTTPVVGWWDGTQKHYYWARADKVTLEEGLLSRVRDGSVRVMPKAIAVVKAKRRKERDPFLRWFYGMHIAFVVVLLGGLGVWSLLHR